MAEGEGEQKKGEGKGFAGLSSLVSDVDAQLDVPPPAKVEPAPAAQAADRPASSPSKPEASGHNQTRQEPVQPPSSGGSSDGDGKWMLLIVVLIGFLIWAVSQSDKNTNPPSSTSAPAMQAPEGNQASAPPKFNDYLSEIYTGQRAKVKLDTDFDRGFRTRLRNTQPQPINFAGEYVLTTWGCGMDCLMGAAVSARTGQVIALPGFVCCWKGGGDKIVFRKNSRLLVLAGLIGEDGQHGSHFYELKNNSFVHVQTIPLEVEEEEYQDPPSTSEPEGLAPEILPSPATETPDNSQLQNNEQYRPSEDKPPVDSNLIFSSPQIRYCVAEGIRLEGAKEAVDNYSDYEVNRFNVMVSDYNSRCGSFRYHRGSLEDARRGVEPHRSQLLSEGRSRFRIQSSGSQSNPTQPTSVAVAPPSYTPPATAQSRQESTRPTSGSIPANAHLNYLGNDWVCDRGYFRHGNECSEVQVPQNGQLTYLGNNWECSRGHIKQGNECREVQVPQNGQLTYIGNNWECRRGYFKQGNECREVQVPQNGKLTYIGNTWECNRGYFKQGNECLAVQVPHSGKLTYLGNGWECNPGFRRVGFECLPIN